MCSFVQYNVCGGGTINFISNTLFDRKGSSRLMGFIAFLPVSALESETNNLFFTQHKDMQWADTQHREMSNGHLHLSFDRLQFLLQLLLFQLPLLFCSLSGSLDRSCCIKSKPRLFLSSYYQVSS